MVEEELLNSRAEDEFFLDTDFKEDDMIREVWYALKQAQKAKWKYFSFWFHIFNLRHMDNCKIEESMSNCEIVDITSDELGIGEAVDIVIGRKEYTIKKVLKVTEYDTNTQWEHSKDTLLVTGRPAETDSHITVENRGQPFESLALRDYDR